MAEITSYDSLLSAVRLAMGRTPHTGSMALATADINRRLRVRQMITEVTQATLTLPADFLEAETVKVADVLYVPSHEGAQARGDGGTFSVNGGSLLLNPADSAPDLYLRYYAKLDELESDTTNDVLTAYPDVYMFGWMFSHARLARDESGVSAWGSAFSDALQSANTANVAALQSGEAMAAMPRASA